MGYTSRQYDQTARDDLAFESRFEEIQQPDTTTMVCPHCEHELRVLTLKFTGGRCPKCTKVIQ